MQNQIFISYRRDGAESLAYLMYERLQREGYKVFLDVETMRSGKFNTQILDVIEKCNDVLLLLPPNGLDRCIDPNDWVRLELECAIKNKKNIIPMYMRHFKFPDELPDSLKDIPYLQGIKADMELFDGVLFKLQKMLKSIPISIQKQAIAENEIEELMLKWKMEIKKADQGLFWNVSRDIYEKAVFYIDNCGAIYFKKIYTGYNIKNISGIVSYRGDLEDDSNVKITFINGDTLIVGSYNYINTMCLETVIDSQLFCFCDEEKIISFWKEGNDQSQAPRQLISTENDANYAWKHCIYNAKLLEYKNVFMIQYGFLVFRGEKSEYKVEDIIEMNYHHYTSPENPDDYSSEVEIVLKDRKIQFYEDAYSEFRINSYPINRDNNNR